MEIVVKQQSLMEKGATSVTRWVGSGMSVILHTILFVVSFTLPAIGWVSFERMLLVLTTVVSLEAIYLSIFIQMSINMNNQNIESIQGDIEELGEDIEELGSDIEELGEGIEELGEDIEELGEDIEELGEGIEELGEDLEELGEDLEEIQKDVDEMQEEVEEIQEEIQEETTAEDEEEIKTAEILTSIQASLIALQKEIEYLKMSHKGSGHGHH
jgi:peptidoglycan hydrolase CwlO-like protein